MDNKLTFKFKDEEVRATRRYQPFMFSEFLGQSGGVMGLFAGISMLSIIEIFYFFPFRLVSDFLIRFIARNRRNI
jgi:Amiloride-sensitive sodium channel